MVIKKNTIDINFENNANIVNKEYNTNIVNINNNNIDTNPDKRKFQILGKPINFSFDMGQLKIMMLMGSNNTFKDAVNNYLLKSGLSDEEDLVFLFNGKKIVDNQMKLDQIGIRDFCHITVIQNNKIVGA